MTLHNLKNSKILLTLKAFLLLDVLKGMCLTFLYLFKKKVTRNYPYEKQGCIGKKYRGRPELHRSKDTGKDLCIGCKLCEVVCPVQAIDVKSTLDKDGNRIASTYDLDMTRCMYCGYCEEACPVHAIVLTKNLEFSTAKKQELYYDKSKWLDPPMNN